ncbi:MAG TPA: hypothetical protein VKH37_00250, partial [Ferruginibacter sp.]|nr:hypothetical protein [Ferruginibacter sp.]
WVDELNKASAKIEVAGKKLDKDMLSLHASSLVRKMEKEFPTVAFSAQLERESKPVFQQQEKLKTFFGKHEEFDLRHSNVDLFFKEKGINDPANAAMKNELKSVQRVFKLVPHYSKANALLANNIHSSQSIVAAGETRFVNEIAPKAGIEKKEATEIFQKAEKRHTAAMLVAGELQDTVSAMNIPALEMKTLSAKLKAVSEDFPNLKSLFQGTDVCACEHCRSVYSPAAYLVEILQFLSKRLVSDLTLAPVKTSNLAKDVLFSRRPDLGEIDLGCENAETPLPYIDLVCELLEEAIAPEAEIAFTGAINAGVVSSALLAALPATWSVTDKAVIYESEVTAGNSAATLPHYLRDSKAVCKINNDGGSNWKIKRLKQTLSPAEELAAAPDYVNPDAYNILNSISNAFAFKLPFDLNHAEASAYFDRFGFSRADLMRNFVKSGTPDDKTIAAEDLGLTDTERTLIVTADPGNQHIYWNTSVPNAEDEMKIVDTFLTKTGLGYTELDLLLQLKFIDPDDKLFIQHEDLSCDTEKKTIANLDAPALDRIHRFLRLQKKTSWKFETLDDIINQAKLGMGKLDDACLIKAGAL